MIREERERDGCTIEEEPLSDKGRDTGLAGAEAAVVWSRCAGVNVGESLEGVVTDGEEAGRTRGVEQDSRGMFVGGRTSRQAAGSGRRRDAGNRELAM